MKIVSKFVALTCLAAATASADTHYVNINNLSPLPPYTNWATAATTIQAVIDAAQSNDTVLVTNGVYATGGRPANGALTNRVVINKPLIVRSVNGPDFTVIKGGGTNGNAAIRCVYLGTNATLIGFTLTNGHTQIVGANDGYGGGVFCEPSAILSNCVLTGNSAYDGGGAYVGTLYHCALFGNSAASGGGARSSTLYNCLLSDNSAYFAGGGACICTLYNCTLIGNSLDSSQYGGGGAYGGVLYNCILYYNTASNGPNFFNNTLNYCCTLPMPTSGVGNITSEPGFMNRLAGDYHLASGSPCIDTGTNMAWMVGASDLEGRSRIVGVRVDRGCYEAPQIYTNASAVHYVSLSGHNIWPYTNWMDAATIIQHAVDTAAIGDTVLVTNGVYDSGGRTANGAMTNRVVIDKPIAVRSVNGPAVTVIKGRGPLGGAAIRCAYVGSYARLEGFTLTNGYTRTDNESITGADESGGGTWCESGGMVSNCVISGNGAHYSGGGVCSFGVVQNCLIVGNLVDRYGGGAAGEGLVSYCEIWNNHAGQDGGGVDNGTVEYCKVWSNAASYGGGTDGSVVSNSVLWGNAATNHGGGTHDGEVVNCAIAGNNASTGGGAEGGTLRNCIIYYNTASNGANYTNTIIINYCCTLPMPTSGVGNITSEPGFVNRLAGDYRLVPGSACIDAGNNAYASGDVDLDGDPRRVNGVVDIGAYEYQLPEVVRPVMVKDINFSAVSSVPEYLTRVGDKIFYSASDNDHGWELWVSDGTREGTVMLEDINPDGDSFPRNLTRVGDILYFTADDGVHGEELWKSDGTPAGTILVNDINGSGSSSPQNLTDVNGTLYFSADDGIKGFELWKSNTNGTVLVKDIYPENQSSWPQELIEMNGRVFFRAMDGTNGSELWMSGGTSTNTVLVKDIYPGGGSSCPCYLTKLNGVLYFSATHPDSGDELWKCNGTSNGTVLVKNIYPGSGSSYPASLTAMSNWLYFSANDGMKGNELWKSNGSNITELVQDIYPGSGHSYPHNLTAIGDTLYFCARDNTHGCELWMNDGTGASMKQDINPGSGDSDPYGFAEWNGTVYFIAYDYFNGWELRKITTEGTEVVRDIAEGTNSGLDSHPYLITFDDGLYFCANDGSHGWELWRSDGTVAGTDQLMDIRPDNVGGFPATAETNCLVEVNGVIYFSASDNPHGAELWKSDGSEVGTVMVGDIQLGDGGSYPTLLTAMNGMLYFSASNSESGAELWKINKTDHTELVRDINPGTNNSSPKNLTTVNGTLYFSASNNPAGRELWKSDGTSALMVRDINTNTNGAGDPQFLTAMNGRLYFNASNGPSDRELWKSDGTSNGTVLVRDINTNANSAGDPQYLTAMNDTLYFSAFSGPAGRELWKSDGTSNGTVLVRDINTNANSAGNPLYLTAMNSTLYFSASNGPAGRELWKSDGTSNGTVLVRDIYTNGASDPQCLTAVNGLLYFSASDSASGRELWKSDGTSNGTVMVKDINPGISNSSPSSLTNINGTLYFCANDGVHGRELWKCDGTTNGTVMVWDIQPGSGSSAPYSITEMNGTLYCLADDGVHGYELWRYALGIIAPPIITPATGLFARATTVSITCPTPGAVIRYTTDGSEPDSGDFIVPANGTVTVSTVSIKAKAFLTGCDPSAVAIGTYRFVCATPVLKPDTYVFDKPTDVDVTNATPNARMFYTTNGIEPTEFSIAVSSNHTIHVDQQMVLKVRAFSDGYEPSATATGLYAMALATPVLTPDSGVFTGFRTVSVACSSTGAVIRYSMDTNEPALSPLIVTNGIIAITRSMTLRVQAFQSGWIPSAIATGAYTVVVETPVITPSGGALLSATNVMITCATLGAEIYYTTDGNDPAKGISPRLSTNGLVYVNRDLTLKARAFLTNCEPSSLAVANFYANPISANLGSLISSPYGSSVGHAPIIRSAASNAPAPGAYLSSVDRVLCTEPNGVMFVAWWNGASYRTNLYVINPVASDVAIYHTESPSKAPPIDLQDTTYQVFIHPNSVIGTNEFWEGEDNQLHARGGVGLVVVHFEGGGAFQGAEVVEVRRYDTTNNLNVALGSRLMPPLGLPTNNPATSYVSRGKMTGRDDANGYIYQHSDAGPFNGALFAVNEAKQYSDMEVFWMKRDSHGLDWPYDMRRYTASWPSNSQLYVRSRESVLPKVALPAGLNAYKFPAEKFDNPTHYGWLQNQAFWTDGKGYSLLMYETGPAGNRNWIGFDVVRSVYRDDASVFNLTPTNWIIGTEITNSYHRGTGSGYIYEPVGDRYHPSLYGERDDLGWTTGQVFAVNEGLLEVWWSNLEKPNTNEAFTIQWPSSVTRYNNMWPTNADRIDIASEQGTGPITNQNWALYYQNDSNQPGFNPNDEHALVQTAKSGGGQRIFALRNDLSRTNSKPFVLMTYDRPGDSSRKELKVFGVETGVFAYSNVRAGDYIFPPHPLGLLRKCNQSKRVSGPAWLDRQLTFWAKAGGDDGGPTQAMVRFFYPMMEGFFFPDGAPQPNIGTELPWLSGGRTGTAVDITYTITWPTNKLPELQLGETLADTKNDLPQIWGQTSVEVIYQQAEAFGKESVRLIDPVCMREVEGVTLPADVETTLKAGEYYFPKLPPQLRGRLSYNPVDKKKLKFKGELVKPAAGEYYLLLNVITDRETNELFNLSEDDPTFHGAITSLIQKASSVQPVLPDTAFDAIALTAGAATAPGYVTLAFNNSTKLNQPADPISLKIIKVSTNLYKGEIKIVESDNVFDERLVLRHSGDFAGHADQCVFEWQKAALNEDGSLSPWNSHVSETGALDVTISPETDSPLITLGDNQFRVRYRSINPLGPRGTDWSEWTTNQLAEGWIKRVLKGINPFEQRFKSFENRQVNKIVSMIAQAGRRCEGDVALNSESADQKGLIEVYESVLRRGIVMRDGYDYRSANDALLLAAGRIADLYMLLGNEAYADATDPTIGFGTDDGQYGAEATSIHCFMNQTASLLEEELDLLRGRDDSLQPPTRTSPFYNRLIWNFSGDIVGGEVAYALNYEIQDKVGQNGDPTPDGFITEDDAVYLYPQGHGDAWGHYLTAIQKGYYRLLNLPNFTWTPHAERIAVGGVQVDIDYLDERKFASVAAAKARAGAEIVNLTYRSKYVEDPSGQWQGYCDSDTNRAWGLSEWACRAGLGSLYDWVVANSLLPASDTNHTGIQKIDRTTVLELREIANAHGEIQGELDKADMGLNPLGLAKNVVPFDIDPTQIDQGKTHFEQIYSRAALAMNNAVTVFNYAQNSSQLLRRQSDTVQNFQQTIDDREVDFNSRLIESFGYPYADDIGPGETYPTGYNGPDIYHFAYMDPSELVGTNVYNDSDGIVQLNINFKDLSVGDDGALIETIVPVTFNLSTLGFGLVKPYNWTGQRRAPGEIQMAQSDIIQANARFQKAILEYENLIQQMEDQANLLAAQYNLNANEIRILNQGLNTQITLDQKIKSSRSKQLNYQTSGRIATLVANAYAEFIPTCVGLASDPMSFIRGAYQLAGSIINELYTQYANAESLNELGYQQAQSEAQTLQNITLTSLRDDYAVLQSLKQLEQSVRQEVTLRLEIYTQQEALQQMAGRYLSALSKGQRLLDDRLRFRQQTAAKLQDYRYKDMAFRIFRNDSLQKYRAQFDLASRYVYLAAKAYDYETNLREGDSRGPGDAFMTQIIRARTIGMIGGSGEPQTGGSDGDGGLADPMARMSRNWEAVLKSQLGFNNPDTETGRFSLRTEMFRILPNADGDKRWEETLERAVVDNVLDLPEFRQYCLPFYPQQAEEPAIVIPFSTGIYFGQNFFGWPAGGGDNTYNSANFATKVRSIGVWFANYNNIQGGGLINTPHVYLVPVGMDIMRSPTDNTGAFREWKVLDQVLPAPFALSEGELDDPTWIPINDTLVNFAACRRIGPFRAYHDSGAFNASETINNSRLIGRSVWNTRWLLIIPAGSLHSDREEGLARFIHGAEIPGTTRRDGNGVNDIKLFFQTYSYSGY